MKTIRTTIVVDAEGKAILRLPIEILPGTHRVTVTVGESPEPSRPFRAEDLPRHDIPWPFSERETFRREDLYGDDGR